jgi:hypothetical protein
VWCVNLRLGVHTDYAHLASLEVYVPTTPGCIYCIFVSYPGWSSLFCHERQSTYRASPRHCYEGGANFPFTEFSEVGRSALATFQTSWRLIHRLVLSWRVTKRHSNRSRRKGNTLGWVVWALMSVMLVCLLLWAATGAVWLLFAAVLAGLGVLYVVLMTNL